MFFLYMDVLFERRKIMNVGITDFESIIKAGYDNIAGIVVMQSGEKVYEGYFDGHTAEDTIHIVHP